jgi:hypothetical protein
MSPLTSIFFASRSSETGEKFPSRKKLTELTASDGAMKHLQGDFNLASL